MPSRAAVSRSSAPTAATRSTAGAPCCPTAPNRRRRQGSGEVVARNRLGRSRRLRPRHHADQPSSRIYCHGKLLLDQCLRATTSQNVQSPAKISAPSAPISLCSTADVPAEEIRVRRPASKPNEIAATLASTPAPRLRRNPCPSLSEPFIISRTRPPKINAAPNDVAAPDA